MSNLERAKRIADESFAADDTLDEYDDRLALEFAANRAAWAKYREEKK